MTTKLISDFHISDVMESKLIYIVLENYLGKSSYNVIKNRYTGHTGVFTLLEFKELIDKITQLDLDRKSKYLSLEELMQLANKDENTPKSTEVYTKIESDVTSGESVVEYTTFKKDAVVFSPVHGKGVVTSVNLNDIYPIKVKFNYNPSSILGFSISGKSVKTDKYPSLFIDVESMSDHIDRIRESEIPILKLEKDTLVQVWRSGDGKKFLRYSAKFDNKGNLLCYPEGTTSYTYEGKELIPWDSWEIYDKGTSNE